jgi:hypothetical protein
MPFLSFDVEIRKVVCSSNAIWVGQTPVSGTP